MASQARERSEPNLFHAGPQFSGGPEFAHAVKKFLVQTGSAEAADLGVIWLEALEDGQLPSWREMALHKRPDILGNAFLMEKTAGDDDFVVRFFGSDAIERAGVDATGYRLSDFDKGELLERWMAAHRYCLDQSALSVVSFDLSFVEKAFRKVNAVLFPLRPTEKSQFVLGFYIWLD